MKRPWTNLRVSRLVLYALRRSSDKIELDMNEERFMQYVCESLDAGFCLTRSEYAWFREIAIKNHGRLTGYDF